MNEDPEIDNELESFCMEQFSTNAEDEVVHDSASVIDRIEERAGFEATLKQSTSFFFLGFSTIITHFVSSLSGHVPPEDTQNNYKP